MPKASGWITEIAVAGKSLWNISARYFMLSYHLMQGGENVLPLILL